ncbi:MAG: ATP-binding protein, partial [Ligilactobacillus sp.]|nr:ATP-binding protein [Ligilactobacillus sp.]
ILGNILDNAIEATPSEKSIKIMLAFKEVKLIFKVKNPYSGIRQQNHNKLRVGSSKRYGRQGIGLRSIKRRVAKYNGYYDFKAVNGEFTAFVVLPILNKRKQEMCDER